MIDLEKMAKEHEKLFPNATLESQVWKLEEEIQEFEKAENVSETIKEMADVQIVCAGLYRWCPVLATTISQIFNLIGNYAVEKEVDWKWQINLKRKWVWNGKTYHHVEE